MCKMCHIFCFLFFKLILAWTLPFHKVDQKFNLSHSWDSPPVMSPPHAMKVQGTYLASKHWRDPFCHPPKLGSLEAPTAFVLRVPQYQSAELELFGHFFRLRQGKRGRRTKECTDISHFLHRCTLLSKCTPSPVLSLRGIQYKLLGVGLGIWK